MSTKQYIFAALLIILLSAGISLKSALAQNNSECGSLTNIWDKDEITIVVTDSGLGGLSVLNDIAHKIEDSGIFKKVDLIFVNALFDTDSGYNSLHNREEKITRLNAVLEGIDERFHPDMIFIACNTLSVIYTETEFIKTCATPVIGIVEPGVKLILEKMNDKRNSRVIIFGTETTIAEASHKQTLIKLGIDPARIITKECPQLQAYIEQNPFGEETELLISLYLEEALSDNNNYNGTTFISLNCSHFGYSIELWENAISNVHLNSSELLNPNTIMGDILISEKQINRFALTEVTYDVVSKVIILNNVTISNTFLENSPELAAALINYTIDPNLFK